MSDEQTEVQDNTNTSTENVSTESATTAENEATNTSTNDQTKESAEPTTESVDEKEAKTEENVSKAPDQYADFVVPEGIGAPIDDFKAWAKENNMTQEAAQSTVDFYVNKIIPQMQAQQETQSAKWVEESTTKYGKDGIEAAKNALGRFSTPEFKDFLDKSGLGNHPEMIGIFKEINSKISEPNLVDGKTVTTTQKRLYPNSPNMYE
jgi:hypothetical protein